MVISQTTHERLSKSCVVRPLYVMRCSIGLVGTIYLFSAGVLVIVVVQSSKKARSEWINVLEKC